MTPTIPSETYREEALQLGLELARKYVNFCVAGNHQRGLVTYDDLLGSANLGVAEALHKWDESRPFGPFAQELIRGRVKDYFRELDPLTRLHRKKVRAGVLEAPTRVDAIQADWMSGRLSNRRSPPEPEKIRRKHCEDCGKLKEATMVKCPMCGYQEDYLTPMEVKCWEHLSRGLRRKTAAFELGISHKTLGVHMMHVSQKLKCEGANIATLTRLWFELGMAERIKNADEKGRVNVEART